MWANNVDELKFTPIFPYQFGAVRLPNAMCLSYVTTRARLFVKSEMANSFIKLYYLLSTIVHYPFAYLYTFTDVTSL